jgi:hypothetical protein
MRETITMKIATVKGADIQPGQVVKIRGRWMRLFRWFDAEWSKGGMRLAYVAPHGADPRLADRPGSRGRMGAMRHIWADDDYLTRDEPAPEWEWVTRQLSREEAYS